MNIIKKGDVVLAKGLIFLSEKNGDSMQFNKGARLRVIKIYNSKTLKVQSVQAKITGNVHISEVEVIK
ncbi:hypothetical protein HBP99_05695 [Listeria booriae]|uniref:hypothetical protein n=1 Tax=Listeria booriae TaxID=1552123 RepID=UPI0016285E6C|nr:hypothetical protein [Listeria booriae]MBC2368118.1 hypothetical protein [Listeria booriae]